MPAVTATSQTTPRAAPSPVVVAPEVCQIRSDSTAASSRTEPGVITRIRSNVRLVPTATRAKTTATVRSSSGRHCASQSTSRRLPPKARTASASPVGTASRAARNTSIASPTQAHTNADITATVTRSGPSSCGSCSGFRPVAQVSNRVASPRSGSGS
nr:hypothetical protein [Verrucosispora sioxanthis]